MLSLNRILAVGTAAVISGYLGSQVANATEPRSVGSTSGTAETQTGTVRVIVRLKAPSGVKAPSGKSDNSEVAAYSAALRKLQDAVIADHFGSSGRSKARAAKLMSISPMFAIRATAVEIARLKADPRVESVQVDALMKPTMLDSLGIIRMTGTGGAYDKNATGSGRAVAIFDTGVRKSHEFLKNKVIAEGCFNTTDAGFGSTTRCPGGVEETTAAGAGADCAPSAAAGCGHGTHVAGIAAGKNTNRQSGEPKNGVAKGAKLVAVNVFSLFSPAACGTSGPCLSAYDSDLIAALDYIYTLRDGVAGTKIDSINMSLGGVIFGAYCDDSLLKPAIDLLRSVGIATVVAAGNEFYINGVSRPGCISSVITVSASTKKAKGKGERVSSYSNIADMTDLLAPGGDFPYPFNSNRSLIKSSYSSGNGKYRGLAGTSMAAPHVAGAIAAIRSRNACENKTVAEIETAFQNSGKSITDHRIVMGFPQVTKRRLNVVAAMKFLGCLP